MEALPWLPAALGNGNEIIDAGGAWFKAEAGRVAF
jgi:hypothetical protein